MRPPDRPQPGTGATLASRARPPDLGGPGTERASWDARCWLQDASRADRFTNDAAVVFRGEAAMKTLVLRIGALCLLPRQAPA